ncbi:MAG: hypothetical protein ACJ8FY_26345 [Gemmataceae bacterium]
MHLIMNNAGEPNPVDVRITIDGNDCVWDVFEYDLLFTRYRLRLAQGQHHLVAESERGQARLEADINVNGILHISIGYWYEMPWLLGSEQPPQLLLHSAKEPWIPDYGWKPKV